LNINDDVPSVVAVDHTQAGQLSVCYFLKYSALPRSHIHGSNGLFVVVVLIAFIGGIG
jgi:hypothetical protein